jgi:hypothetical protein
MAPWRAASFRLVSCSASPAVPHTAKCAFHTTETFALIGHGPSDQVSFLLELSFHGLWLMECHGTSWRDPSLRLARLKVSLVPGVAPFKSYDSVVIASSKGSHSIR